MTLSETPNDAAHRLAASAIRNGHIIEALHPYTDSKGSILHWRIRAKHPDTGEKWIRPMKLNSNGFVLGEPDYPNGKPLYRLQDLTARPHDPVFVVEGEWCADQLAKAGVLATTSGSAESAGKADWQSLTNRSVVIWPDNDDAGQHYAHSVAEALLPLGCTISLIDISALNLPIKGDATDWIKAHTHVTASDIKALPTICWTNTGEDSDLEADISKACGPIRFAFTPVSDLQIKPIDWLIIDHLESESLAEVFGPPESGKSLLAIDWALCIASGAEWNGHATKQGAVFYIAGEGHNGLMRRFTAWSKKNEIPLGALPLYVSNCSAAFFNETSALEVEMAISAMARAANEIPRLIVIDTLARNFGGGNENSTEDMSLFIRHIDRYLRERFHSTVLIVHHTGLASTERGRGSTALKAAADTEFSMKRDNNLIRFSCTKMKDAPHPAEKAFMIEQIDLGIVNDDHSPMQSVILTATDYVSQRKPDTGKLGKNQQKALSVLIQLTEEHRQNMIERGDDPDEAKVSVKLWETKTGLDRMRFKEAKDTLFMRGIVRLLNSGYFAEPIIEEYDDK